MAVFLLFLLATAAGCISTLFWIPEDDLGRGYFQMNALIVLGLLGVLLTGGATAAAYLGGSDSLTWTIMAIAGAVVLSLAVPPIPKARKLSRLLALSVVVTLVRLGDPTGYAAEHTDQ